MDITTEHALTLAHDFVQSTVGRTDDKTTEVIVVLDALAPGHSDLLLHLFAGAVAVGYSAGQAAQAPPDDRLTIVVRALRGMHVREMFGDCTEDGDPYPCRTVRALDIVSGPDEPDEQRDRSEL
jgi:hypothetical protein